MTKAEIAKLLKENGIVILSEKKYLDLIARAAAADGLYEFCADCKHYKTEVQSTNVGFCAALNLEVCGYDCGHYEKRKDEEE